MRRYKTDDRTFSEINITPFTDIILVLLIIFMVSAPLYTFRFIKISVSKTDARGGGTENNIAVSITNDEKLFVDNSLVNESQLGTVIRTKVDENPNRPVTLYADKKILYTKVAEILGSIRASGARKIYIVIQQ